MFQTDAVVMDVAFVLVPAQATAKVVAIQLAVVDVNTTLARVLTKTNDMTRAISL